mmetsp:Transcript_6256/g.10404  ORF Transcript_6256/g.10404 Transcript_6256/m.10404 type:complete len:214 (-) Transcript_6256:200-841(-)
MPCTTSTIRARGALRSSAATGSVSALGAVTRGCHPRSSSRPLHPPRGRPECRHAKARGRGPRPLALLEPLAGGARGRDRGLLAPPAHHFSNGATPSPFANAFQSRESGPSPMAPARSSSGERSCSRRTAAIGASSSAPSDRYAQRASIASASGSSAPAAMLPRGPMAISKPSPIIAAPNCARVSAGEASPSGNRAFAHRGTWQPRSSPKSRAR